MLGRELRLSYQVIQPAKPKVEDRCWDIAEEIAIKQEKSKQHYDESKHVKSSDFVEGQTVRVKFPMKSKLQPQFSVPIRI